MKRFLKDCNYDTAHDFWMSMFPSFKYKLAMITISVSAVSGVLEVMLGLKGMTILAFIALLSVELISGLYASLVIRKESLESSKMGRFSIKLALWLITLFILNSFCKEYEGKNALVYGLFHWLHSGLFIYASCEYLVSVLENISTISGKDNTTLINAIKSKLNNFLGK